MSYANPLMLIGLAGVLIPIIIHLITQHRAKRVDWGATLFLQESVVHRSRRMLLEQILLLVARCLLVGLIAMALALPFVRPDSRVSWGVVLPLVLLGLAALGAAAALNNHPRWRFGLGAIGILLLGLAALPGVGKQSSLSGDQDIVIIIDGSDSMNIAVDGVTNFQAATAEAAAIIEGLRPGNAATLIVAGADVQIQPPAPSRQQEELKQVIQKLVPAGGTMTARDAFAAAKLASQRGENLNKKIVVITDGQSVGWAVDGEVDWKQVAEPLDDLPVKPQIVLRRLPLPKRIDNVQISAMTVADGVLSADREVPVEVRLENGGTEAINTPIDVELAVDNDPQPLRQSVTRLAPGVPQSLTFHVRLSGGGLHSLSARVPRPDDLPWDNQVSRVVRSFEQIPVLLIDGNPTARVRDRATWYLDLALAPDPNSTPHAEREEYSHGLYRVTRVDLPKVDSVGDLRQYRAVVLADVAKLPTTTAVKLADFVADGGGLLISLGSRSQMEFYNSWQARGAPLLPATLVERRVADAAHPAVQPVFGSFKHPSLRVFADNPETDIATGSITAYWRMQPQSAEDKQRICASLSSGDPWLMERRIGQGGVIVSTVSLDREGSNLSSRRSFAVLVQELVGHLTQLPSGGSEVATAGQRSLELRPLGGGQATGETGAKAVPGLRGQYFAGADFRRALTARIDPAVAIQWPASPIEGLTEPEFSVRWTGTLTPPATDAYTFTLEGEQTQLWINGKLVAATGQATAAPQELIAGQPYAIRVEHTGKSGQGKCELYWQGKQLGKQLVPGTSFTAWPAWRVQSQKNLAAGSSPAMEAELTGPDGKPIAKASVLPHADGATVALGERLKPGLYSLRLPDSMRDEFEELMTAESLPVAVLGNSAESQLAPLSDNDLASAHPDVLLTSADSASDVLQQLRGGDDHLWRYLAIAALVLAVAEIALARWIAVQRMVGHEPTVVFAADASRPTISRAAERFSSFSSRQPIGAPQ